MRLALLGLAALFSLGAQTAPDTAPIVMTATIGPVDPQARPDFRSAWGIFMFVRNISDRPIEAYVYHSLLTDPETGAILERSSHGGHKDPSLGAAIESGATLAEPRPYPLRLTASGVPANRSFTIDLVVFEDGSTWGPADTNAAKNMLRRIRNGAPKR